MKRFSISILFFTVAIILTGCSNNEDKIIGEWSGLDKRRVLKLILDKNGDATLVDNNLVLGGKDFVVRGIKAQMKYEINYSKEPIWLDLVVSKKDTEEKITFKGIVKFITDTKIQYRVNLTPNGERFDGFDVEEKSNSIVLDKVK